MGAAVSKPSLHTSLALDELRVKHLAATLQDLGTRTDLPAEWRLAYALDYVADFMGWHPIFRDTADDEVTCTYRATRPTP